MPNDILNHNSNRSKKRKQDETATSQGRSFDLASQGVQNTRDINGSLGINTVGVHRFSEQTRWVPGFYEDAGRTRINQTFFANNQLPTNMEARYPDNDTAVVYDSNHSCVNLVPNTDFLWAMGTNRGPNAHLNDSASQVNPDYQFSNQTRPSAYAGYIPDLSNPTQALHGDSNSCISQTPTQLTSSTSLNQHFNTFQARYGNEHTSEHNFIRTRDDANPHPIASGSGNVASALNHEKQIFKLSQTMKASLDRSRATAGEIQCYVQNSLTEYDKDLIKRLANNPDLLTQAIQLFDEVSTSNKTSGGPYVLPHLRQPLDGDDLAHVVILRPQRTKQKHNDFYHPLVVVVKDEEFTGSAFEEHKFFKAPYYSLIGRAALEYQAHTFWINSFPELQRHIPDFVNEELETVFGFVENGRVFYNLSSLSHRIYVKQYLYGITIAILKKRASFRNPAKKAGQKIVVRDPAFQPAAGDVVDENAKETALAKYNSEKHDDAFLKGVHPTKPGQFLKYTNLRIKEIIEAILTEELLPICKAKYANKSYSNLVAFGTTALEASIDEFSTGLYDPVQFKGSKVGRMYERHVKGALEVENDSIDGPEFKKVIAGWLEDIF